MNSIKRATFLLLGALSLALGVIGIVLPILPTTPFILLAAFFFAQSSERLHAWLLNHPRFGPSIRDWQQHRAISRFAKKLAILTMIGVLAVSLLLQLPLWVITVQALAMLAVSIFILTRPSPPG